MRTYGWRAYAIPVLAILTVVALVHGRGASGHHASLAAQSGHQGKRAVPQHLGQQPAGRDRGRVQIEGLTGGEKQFRGFRAGATPPPVTITLGSDVSSCAQNSYRKLVLVSIRRQHLWACHRHRQVNETPITTGKVVDDDRTPTGSWRVQDKQRDRYLVGPGYRDYVHFWVPFNGDFGLHDAPWQTMPFGSSQWRTHGSHGCVHVPSVTMSWLYRWSQVGTTVVTVER